MTHRTNMAMPQGTNARKSRILHVHIETSSLWADFGNKNRCISVRVVSEEDKSIEWMQCQAVTFVLCLHYRPETVHCSTKDAYTYEITFLAL